MTNFQIISSVLLIVALFGWINYRFLKLPDAIGITAVSVIASLIVLGLSEVIGYRRADSIREFTAGIDCSSMLLHGVLGLLLFAGSLQIEISDLADEKWMVLVLATVGVVVSTGVVGIALYMVTRALSAGIPMIHCLLFGALISPTDPVAVMAVLKRAKVPKSLETRIAGESMFNDGAAIALFLALLGVAASGDTLSIPSTALSFLIEVVGAFVFGGAFGYTGYWMLRGVESYPVEILITLAMATAGYALADAIHVSAPIAVVLMGLIIGNKAAAKAMSADTRRRLFDFWGVVDELLNLLLFALIGLQMLSLDVKPIHFVIGGAAILIVLVARLVSIAGPIFAAPRLREYGLASIAIMTWGGLRGGISIAMALSLPDFSERDTLLSATYMVVIFSILVQALSLGRVTRRVLRVARDKGQKSR
jgi:CPA1 family monovalent cation:H+ antiporter